MTRPAQVVAILCLLAASGCGGSGARSRTQRELLDALDATQRASRAFSYSETTSAGTIEVTGRVADDLRYEGTLRAGGVEQSSAVVSDDALAVRFATPSAIRDLARLAAADRPLADALSSGRWIVDHSAAPPLVAPRTKLGSIEVGADPLMDAAYVFQYLRRAVDDAVGIRQFDPDDVDYNARDDPFASLRPDRSSGVKRFDVVAPPIPRRSQRGTQSASPTTAMFRKVAFIVRGGHVLRVLESIDVDGVREVRLAIARGGPQFVLDMRQSVRAGRTREPVRERRMTLELSSIGRPQAVELPLEGVVPGSLAALVGTPAK